MTETRARKTVSAYIITKDEERNIGRAIGSIRWMEEIIVLDSGSTDATVSIARDLGAKVTVTDFKGFVAQKNTALDICSGDWAFNLDADEEVTPELRRSIETILTADYQSTVHLSTVYSVSRRTWYMGRWILHCGWYPEYRPRLSKRNAARWTGESIHESLESEGPSGILGGDLLHRPYADIGEHLVKIGRYTDMWAKREQLRGRKATLFDLIARPPARFFKMYLLRGGFLDGLPGFIVSCMGMIYAFLKYARLHELSKKDR